MKHKLLTLYSFSDRHIEQKYLGSNPNVLMKRSRHYVSGEI